MLIRNKTLEGREIEVGEFSAYVESGETIEVPDEIANGSPAQGEEFLDDEKTQRNPEFHPGTSGLLAQDDVWEKASAPRKPKNDDAPSDGEEV